MPIHVNEHAITALATTLGVDAAALKSELVVDAAEAPKETKVQDLLQNVVVLGKHAYDAEKKTKYDEGRNASIGIPLQIAYKSKLGAEKTFTLSRYEDAAAEIEKLADAVAEKKIKEAGIEPDKQVQRLTQDLDTLRQELTNKDKLVSEWQSKNSSLESFTAAEKKVIRAVASTPLAAEGQAAIEQREAIETLFFARYDVKVENGAEVVYKKGTDERMLTQLREPVPVADVVKGIITTLGFPTAAASSGRGDQSSGSNQNQSQSEAIPAEVKTMEALKTWMKGKGIADRSKDYIALVTEFYKKNPDAK